MFILMGNEAIMLQLSPWADPCNMLFMHCMPSVNCMKEMVSWCSSRRIGYSKYPRHQSPQGALNEADLQNLNIDHMNSITKNEVACRVTNTLIDTGQ